MQTRQNLAERQNTKLKSAEKKSQEARERTDELISQVKGIYEKLDQDFRAVINRHNYNRCLKIVR